MGKEYTGGHPISTTSIRSIAWYLSSHCRDLEEKFPAELKVCTGGLDDTKKVP